MASQKISTETMIAYVTGELGADAAARLEAHLAGSPGDAVRLKRIRATIQTMRTDDSVAPPAETLARAQAIFKPAEAPSIKSWLQQLERVVADLVFDSRTQPALAGYRGADEAVQLSYDSGVAAVDLEAVPGPAGEREWTVRGQVSIDAPESDVRVALLSHPDERILMETEPDVHGVFKLRIDSGRYDLVICVSNRAVFLPNIELN